MTTLTQRLATAAVGLALGAQAFAADLAHVVMLDGAPAAHAIADARAEGRTLSADEIQAERATIAAAQDAFLAQLDAQGINYSVASVDIPDFTGATTTVDLRYTLVNNAIALNIDAAAATAIANMAGVKAVERDSVHPINLDRSVDYTRAPEVYGAIKELTQFDDHREGLEGQGMYISVIDTGIDWTHEQFGGDATPPQYGTNPPNAAVGTNGKVVYYLGLFDNLLDDYGHGTHVAATAAGYLGYAPGPDGVPLTGDDVAVHGVAPQAKLMGYKVCSGLGSSSGALTGVGVGCLGTAIALALEDSVSPRTLTGQPKPVAHVINMSLGGSGNADDFSSTNANNAVLAGSIVIAAAGNDGPDLHTLGSPSLGNLVVSVAAHNDPGVFPNSVDAAGRKMPAFLSGDSNAQQPINDPIVSNYVFVGFGDTPDQVPATVLNRICLVERGSTAEAADNGTGLFANKAAQCQAKGAIATLVFNNVPGEIGGVLAPAANPVLTMSQENGQYLLGLGFDETGVSLEEISVNPVDPSLFAPSITGFSSRGPSPKLYQVKPDLAAPGEAVLAATTMVGVPVASMASATRYTAASGTSMATPHVAGAAALIKQANLEWGADEVRAALMNTATDGRDASGAETANDNIISQGAGLIDVHAAANISALMGVVGDGSMYTPSILASHNFGKVPVVNSRTSHTESVTITLRDVSGNGGTFELFTVDNRDTAIPGVSTSVADATVTVPAGGDASTTLNVSVDGDIIRSLEAADGHRLRLQGYVIAARADGGELLRMPFYYQPEMSQPAGAGGTVTWTESGLLPAADAGLQLVGPVTFVDHEVDATDAVAISADLSATMVTGVDLDLFLLDADGNEIAASTTAGSDESLTDIAVAPGIYTVRVNGWANGPTTYDLTISKSVGGQAPVMNAFEEDSEDANGTPVSFDGTVNVMWDRAGGEQAFEVLYSENGTDFTPVAQVDGSQTSWTMSGLATGTHHFRVRGMHDGVIGYYVTDDSDTASVIVDKRRIRNITRKVSTRIDNVTFDGATFAFDLMMTNDSNKTWLPHVVLQVRNIKSNSGTVTVANADNGGDGTSRKNGADFSYDAQLGADGEFTSGEQTGARRLEFHDPMAELFSFKVRVTGHKRIGDAPSDTDEVNQGGSESAEEPPAEDGDPVGILQVTANPLTGTVDIQLVDDLL